jgi:GNAT superfamily N-acetyltransferase
MPGLRSFLTDEERQKFGQGWQRPPGDGGWRRAWGAFAAEHIIGHADLTADPIPTASHRVTLGMGVEQAYHRQGLGRSLLGMAVSVARAHRFCWLDLRVFAANTPAIALYQKVGFIETGRVEDRFRIDDVSITDISMSLPLAPVLGSRAAPPLEALSGPPASGVPGTLKSATRSQPSTAEGGILEPGR